jgi:hypothetical protein
VLLLCVLLGTDKLYYTCVQVPILAFFNRYRGNLDDSERRSHAFLSAWAVCVGVGVGVGVCMRDRGGGGGGAGRARDRERETERNERERVCERGKREAVRETGARRRLGWKPAPGEGA